MLGTNGAQVDDDSVEAKFALRARRGLKRKEWTEKCQRHWISQLTRAYEEAKTGHNRTPRWDEVCLYDPECPMVPRDLRQSTMIRVALDDGTARQCLLQAKSV